MVGPGSSRVRDRRRRRASGRGRGDHAGSGSTGVSSSASQRRGGRKQLHRLAEQRAECRGGRTLIAGRCDDGVRSDVMDGCEQARHTAQKWGGSACRAEANGLPSHPHSPPAKPPALAASNHHHRRRAAAVLAVAPTSTTSPRAAPSHRHGLRLPRIAATAHRRAAPGPSPVRVSSLPPFTRPRLPRADVDPPALAPPVGAMDLDAAAEEQRRHG